MKVHPHDPDPLRVLVLAPTGRDAALTCSALADRGSIVCEPVEDLEDLCGEICRGAGSAILAEEALFSEGTRCLKDLLASQPAWSDLAIIIMTSFAATSEISDCVEQIRQRGSITLLDRPLKVMTLLTAVHAALRARQRQYQVRDLLIQTRNDVRHRDQFLAMLGHELRNPLAAITTAMNVLDASSPPSDRFEQEQRQIIIRQSRHLSRLVDDLLDVSRITSGKISLAVRPVDLGSIAQQALKAVEPLVRTPRHETRLVRPPEAVIVEADPVRLEQIVSNLLTNAVKYTPPGGIITLTVDASDGSARLSVRDNGLGIGPELLPRVFDLFTQADRSLDRAGRIGNRPDPCEAARRDARRQRRSAQ